MVGTNLLAINELFLALVAMVNVVLVCSNGVVGNSEQIECLDHDMSLLTVEFLQFAHF